MTDTAKKPIGIFDSGLGGITVLKEIIKLLPNEDFIYFGDSKRAPYGTKSKETITNFSFQDVRFLVEKDVKAIVVACNTVSSNSIEEIKKSFDVPLVEVIGPGARAGAFASRNKKVAVIGTEATVNSEAYINKLNQIDDEIKVIQKSCPLLVPIVEEGSHMWNSKIAKLAVDMYLEEIRNSGADTLILGCTHYPLLKELIQEAAGESILIVDSAYSTAVELQSMFDSNSGNIGKISIYTSDSREKFLPMSRSILGNDNFVVEQIDIEKY